MLVFFRAGVHFRWMIYPETILIFMLYFSLSSFKVSRIGTTGVFIGWKECCVYNHIIDGKLYGKEECEQGECGDLAPGQGADSKGDLFIAYP